MFTFMELALTHKSRMDSLRKKYKITMAHYSFASLYMWQKELKTTICMKRNFFALKEEHRSKHFYYFPCGNDKDKLAFIRYALKKHGDKLCLGYMGEQDRAFLERNFRGSFVIVEDRDSFEYVYSKEDQMQAYGKHFRNLRKELNTACRSMKLSYEIITSGNIEEVKQITLDWNRLHAGDGGFYTGDVKPTLRMLEHYKKLGLFGILIRNGQKACSYIIGAELWNNTVEILMSKCSLPGNGLDFFTKILFYHTLDPSYQYINQEDDMGVIGIRTKKQEQQPNSLTTVWKAIAI